MDVGMVDGGGFGCGFAVAELSTSLYNV
jgi:hypothetical protein